MTFSQWPWHLKWEMGAQPFSRRTGGCEATTLKRTVLEALTDFRWIRDLHGVLSAMVLCDLLSLADPLFGVTLQQDQPDKHV
jgi:hypothetical protein